MAARSGKEDYYEILGLSRNCTQTDIKKAFLALAKEKHPDVSKDPNATKEFQKINEAYKVLSDPQQRKIYDSFGHEGLSGAAGSSSGFHDAGFSSSINDFFEDIMGDFFGGRKRSKRSVDPEQVYDAEKNITISFREAVLGTECEIEADVAVPCVPCKQTGAASAADVVICSYCNGNGIREIVNRFFGGIVQQKVVCDQCQGMGKLIKNKCASCKGNRYNWQKQNLRFRVPPSTFDGSKLRIKGKGAVPPRGSNGKPGDLVVNINVVADKYFQLYNDHDLLIRVPISYLDSLLGAKVQIPTIDNRILEREIKPGIQSGDYIEIAKEGCYSSRSAVGHRGKLVVVFDVIIPKKLQKNEKKLLLELKKDSLFTPNDDFIKDVIKK